MQPFQVWEVPWDWKEFRLRLSPGHKRLSLELESKDLMPYQDKTIEQRLLANLTLQGLDATQFLNHTGCGDAMYLVFRFEVPTSGFGNQGGNQDLFWLLGLTSAPKAFGKCRGKWAPCSGQDERSKFA